MDGKELIGRMKPLSQVESMKQVAPLSNAMFPGTHCPLMGAAMAVRGIRNSLIMIIGTDECAYYTKHMTIHSEEFGGLGGRCVSVVLDGHDVTFGCLQKVEAAFGEVMEEYRPQAVFLVTTCVVEIIGDDMDAAAEALTKKYGIPVMAVHTEHFKCENHLPGLERTITACFALMEKKPCDGRVNLLGQRIGSFEATELNGVLQRAGVKIGLQLPCGCTVEDIREGAAAKANIVVNEIALPLAKKMEEEFGIPYVFFDRFAEPEQIDACYRKLFEALELPLPDELKALKVKAAEAKRQAMQELNGVTYIYGNTPFRTFEFNHFMVSLGMIPQVIQTSAITPADEENKTAILEKCDPYITKTANIAPLQYVYDELHPMLYLGHEYASRLRQKGIAMVRTDGANSLLGFEVTGFAVKALLNAARECREIRKGGVA